ncbi:MAG: transcription termination factor Rho, partial [Gemmataceae bacterium]|nr:transcription termination factor Rho [Gemmataceae bacterium]
MSEQTQAEPHGYRHARGSGPPDDRPPPTTHAEEEGFLGYDDEVNSRYEEIKRGGTYITELQQMTMVQLQQLAKDEELPREEWIGLKKQDLIFKVLKERVKQNGLMYGEG